MASIKVESAFGEAWEAKRERILGPRLERRERGGEGRNVGGGQGAVSPSSLLLDAAASAEMFSFSEVDTWPPYDLRCFIVKSNDDLR